MKVLRQEIHAEARENQLFTLEDVEIFVSTVVYSLILSSLNSYPTSLVMRATRNQDDEQQKFRDSFENLTKRLEKLVADDISLANAGKILENRS